MLLDNHKLQALESVLTKTDTFVIRSWMTDTSATDRRYGLSVLQVRLVPLIVACVLMCSKSGVHVTGPRSRFSLIEKTCSKGYTVRQGLNKISRAQSNRSQLQAYSVIKNLAGGVGTISRESELGTRT
jgi:hypothetical protein